MVSLKSKLLSSLLYLLSSVYIFARFINSLPKPQLNKVDYINKVGCTDKMGYIGYRVGEVKIRVSVILILVKLFLKRQLIHPKLNFPLVAIYSLISSLVYSIGLSFYSVLKSDYRTVIYIFFFNPYSINLKEVLEVTNSCLVIILKGFYYKGTKVLIVKLL